MRRRFPTCPTPSLALHLSARGLSMKFSAVMALLGATVPAAFGAGATLHLLQKPAMNKTEIVFSYAGDLWSVGRQGGLANRLTSGAGVETEPAFSPDGKTIAFPADYAGHATVFTLPLPVAAPTPVPTHP